MKTTHTPGPWRWVGGSLEAPDGTVLCVEDRPEHAYPELQTGVLAMDNPEGDRPLIAAAPKLLAALNDLTEAVCGAIHLPAYPDVQASVNAAEAAIASATGGEQ